jgi:hypothetical protein
MQPYRVTESSPLPWAPKMIGIFLKIYTWTH